MLDADIQLRLSGSPWTPPSRAGGRGGRPARPERLGQVHGAARPGRPAGAGRGPDRAGRQGARRPRPAMSRRNSGRSADVPGLPALPAPERAGERGVRAAGRGTAGGPRAPRRRSDGPAGLDGWPRPSRARCPAGSSSGWRWPARWSPSPGCCFWTSPWPPSTSPPRPTSGACSGGPARVPRGERARDPRPARRRGARRPDGRPRERRDRADRDPRRGHRPPAVGYVADLIGVNLLRGTARGTVLELDGGGQLIPPNLPAPSLSSSRRPGFRCPGSGPRGRNRTPGQDRSARSISWATACGSAWTGRPRSPARCRLPRSTS